MVSLSSLHAQLMQHTLDAAVPDHVWRMECAGKNCIETTKPNASQSSILTCQLALPQRHTASPRYSSYHCGLSLWPENCAMSPVGAD